MAYRKPSSNCLLGAISGQVEAKTSLLASLASVTKALKEEAPPTKGLCQESHLTHSGTSVASQAEDSERTRAMH